MHPKIQFPSVNECPDCYAETDGATLAFNRDKILRFLLDFYSPSNIIGLESGNKGVIPELNPVDDKPGEEPIDLSTGKSDEEELNRDKEIDLSNQNENRGKSSENSFNSLKINLSLNDQIDAGIDSYLSCILVFVVFVSLGGLFFYYRMLRRGTTRTKRHIV